MDWNLADLFEALADADPDREVVVAGDVRYRYGSLDARANQLGHALEDRGVQAGQHVGIYAHNRAEYYDAFYGLWKIGAVAINVNHRYVEEELRYLIGNADLVGVIVERRFLALLARLAPEFPGMRTVLVLDDGSDVPLDTVPGAERYEDALAGAPTTRGFAPRTADALYVLYTGGTTGMPKGVMWRHEDIFRAALDAGNPPVERPQDIAARVVPGAPPRGISLATAPLMHGSAQWTSFAAIHGGNRVVLYCDQHFDADRVLELAARERCTSLSIVGDGMGRPIAEALASGRHPDLAVSLIGSGGAMLSAAVKEQLRAAMPGVVVADSFGASETGFQGTVRDFDGPAAGPRFTMNEETTVITDDGSIVEPGSGVVGKLARSGHIPLGYYRDPEKSAATFPVLGGRRWVVPGDLATVEADGTITVFGRGSTSINTGGEKVFPEEVEAALRSHPGVFDALVCGVPDERFGERVVALVQPRDGASPTLEQLQAHCRDHVAGYKLPRSLVLGPVQRTSIGKPDYVWARSRAREALEISDGGRHPTPGQELAGSET